LKPVSNIILNQNPEQKARDNIDKQLIACGWLVQDKDKINLQAGLGVAIREYTTDTGPADYILFVDKKPLGVIEAKKEDAGVMLMAAEDQSREYAEAKLKYLKNDPLPFAYESTGEITRFTDYRDPKPRSREVFTFHRPETLVKWVKDERTLRARFFELPELDRNGLRDCQVNAIQKLETSFKENRPRALIQMATGSGKTFTAITFIYRLLKHARANRVLFLVDTKNLGEQAEQEFMAYVPNDDNRVFTKIYGVTRLTSSYVPTNNQVYISTIQRFYSILKGEELDESAEETNPGEIKWEKREPVPVAYNPKIPIEFFDFVVIDECHRSIYNLWKQVLDYYDSFLIGLTATPDNRTFGFFNQNVVSEYTHEQAVADGVNVGYDVFTIETEITRRGSVIWKGEYVDHREKLTRKKRWEQLDEDKAYAAKQLDNEVVNPNQIRLIIKTFKEHLPEMFPDRFDEKGIFEIPKTLIFAKTDSHADDIIQIVREEFAEENRFCKKITYGSNNDKRDENGNIVEKGEDPKSTLSQFRNDYLPRIAVTVDMIATGTDVKPLECLLFMRDVKSRNYFEQMKGRGTRTINLEDLRKITPSAKITKDHFVIVDAIGVTESLKTDSRPLEKKPGEPLKDLLGAINVGIREEELFTTLAGRLARLDKQITEKEKVLFREKAGGKTINEVVKDLMNAYNPDILEEIKIGLTREYPIESPLFIEEKYKEKVAALKEKAAAVFTGELNTYIENVRKAHAQVIDHINPDKLTGAGWGKNIKEKAQGLISDFTSWLEENKDSITALQIFYNQPYRRREVTYRMINEVLDKLRADRPALAPLQVWQAYEKLGEVKGSPEAELIALVSLIRHITGIDEKLTDFSTTIDRNFQNWILKKNAGKHNRFTEEQMQWIRMIKEHIAWSFHLDADDLDYTPFDSKGGKGKMWQLFREEMDDIINELNEALAA
jgi:type I restriction enzyme R subunit